MLKLMTFNLRYDKPDPGTQNWAIRKDSIFELINYYQPDLIGTQELKLHQLLELQELLPNYQSVGGDRTGNGTDEHCSIFYKRSRITCLETKDFYLSETPTIPGSITPDWGNYAPRMATWGIFNVIDQSQSFILVNTHLAHLSSKAQEFSAELIVQYCQQFPLKESYLFLTGDFNTSPKSKARETFKQPLSDSVHFNDTLKNFNLEEQMTFHEFTGKGCKAIDTIYYDCRVRLQNIVIDKKQWKDVFPSDHFPVIADFLLF